MSQKNIKEIDRVKNIGQKELALNSVGITRQKVYKIIAEALEAKTELIEPDAKGNLIFKEIPDNRRREWAVDKVVKLLGDEVLQNNTETVNNNFNFAMMVKMVSENKKLKILAEEP